MSVWELWVLLVVVPGLNTASFGMIVIGMMACIATGIFGIGFAEDGKVTGYEGHKDIAKKAFMAFKASMAIVVAGTVFSIAAPDREQIMYIVGGNVVTNAEGIDELPDNLVQYANRFLEDTEKGHGESEGRE